MSASSLGQYLNRTACHGCVAPSNEKRMESVMMSKFNSMFALATAAAIVFGGVSSAVAATLDVTSVNGNWTGLGSTQVIYPQM